MSVVSRKTAREALATYLTSIMTSATAVYAYQVADFNKQSPVCYLTSSKAFRERFTRDGFNSEFSINLHTFVLYPSEKTTGYTEQDAENILDQLEQETAEAVLAIKNHEIIKNIRYGEPSNADDVVEIGGETYLHEIIPLILTC